MTTAVTVEVKREPPDMGDTVNADVASTIEGEFISPQELLRQHMTASAMDSINKTIEPIRDKTPEPTDTVIEPVTKKTVGPIITKKKKKMKPKTVHYDSFKCGKCKKEFANKGLLLVHFQIHSTEFPFECVECEQKFKIKKYLQRHKRRVHEKKKHISCDVCGKLFNTRYHLKMHSYIHTGEKPFTCDVCEKSFNRSHTLAAHKLIHTKEKPYKCGFCAYACRDQSTLRKHEARHTGSGKEYTCNICKKRFKCKARLKRHVAEEHLNAAVKTYECADCGVKCKNRQGMVQHTRDHLYKVQYPCSLCGKIFYNYSNMKFHLSRHYDNKPYRCTDCNQAYKVKSDLERHRIIHDPSRHHPCPTCGRLFARRHRLTRHMKQHAVKKKQCPCPHCGVCFYNESYVKKHVRMKHGRRRVKFECDYCGLTTTMKPSLIGHIKAHHKKKTFKCQVCGMMFKNLTPLKLHGWDRHRIQYKTHLIKKELGIVDEEINPDLPIVIKEEQLDIEDHDLTTEAELQAEAETQAMTVKDFNELIIGGGEATESLAKSLVTRNSKELRKVPDILFDQFFIEKDERPVKLRDYHAYKSPKPYDRARYRKATNTENEANKPVDKTPNRIATDKAKEYDRPKRNVRPVDYKKIDEGVELDNDDKKIAVIYPQTMKIKKPRREVGANVVKTKKRKSNKCKNSNSTINDNDNEKCDQSETLDNNLIDDIREPESNENETNLITNDMDTQKDKERNEDKEKNNDVQEPTFTSRYGRKIKCKFRPNDTMKNKSTKDVKNKTENENVLDKIIISKVHENYGKYYQVKFNSTFQCYVCFKLYESRDKLLAHCKEHFNVNTKKQVSKCPLCDYECCGNSRKGIYNHMKNVHYICLSTRSTKIDIKKTPRETKYVVKLSNRPYNKATKQSERDKILNKHTMREIEIIPTLSNLNRQAFMELDRKKRERNRKTVLKSKLIRKGKNWIVEKVPLEVNENEIKEIIDKNSNLNVGEEKEDLSVDPYLEKLKDLAKKAKKDGRQMLFPCDKCEKVCQAFCGIKLHRRVHNLKAKPFKPKVWKHKLKPADIQQNKPVKPISVDDAKPQPIKGKHHCDKKLMKFYENCIRGSNIEFQQFLKIYNKLDRDDVNDFVAAEFGVVPEKKKPNNELDKPNISNKKNKQPSVENKSNKFVRVIKISKSLHLKRLAKMEEMRKNSVR